MTADQLLVEVQSCYARICLAETQAKQAYDHDLDDDRLASTIAEHTASSRQHAEHFFKATHAIRVTADGILAAAGLPKQPPAANPAAPGGSQPLTVSQAYGGACLALEELRFHLAQRLREVPAADSAAAAPFAHALAASITCPCKRETKALIAQFYAGEARRLLAAGDLGRAGTALRSMLDCTEEAEPNVVDQYVTECMLHYGGWTLGDQVALAFLILEKVASLRPATPDLQAKLNRARLAAQGLSASDFPAADLSIAPNGQALALITPNGEAVVYSLLDGSQLYRRNDRRYKSVGLANEYLYTTSEPDILHVHRIYGDGIADQVSAGRGHAVITDVNADGAWVLISRPAAQKFDALSVRDWRLHELDHVTDMRVSRDGSLFGARLQDGTCCAYTLKDGKWDPLWQHRGADTLSFSSRATAVALHDSRGGRTIYESRSGTFVYSATLTGTFRSTIFLSARCIADVFAGGAVLVDLRSGDTLANLRVDAGSSAEDSIVAAGYVPERTLLIAVTSRGRVRQWNVCDVLISTRPDASQLLKDIGSERRMFMDVIASQSAWLARVFDPASSNPNFKLCQSVLNLFREAATEREDKTLDDLIKRYDADLTVARERAAQAGT